MQRVRPKRRTENAALCLIAATSILLHGGCKRLESTDTMNEGQELQLPVPIRSPAKDLSEATEVGVATGSSATGSSATGSSATGTSATGSSATGTSATAAMEVSAGREGLSNLDSPPLSRSRSEVGVTVEALAGLVVNVQKADPEGGIVKIAIFNSSDSFKQRDHPFRAADQQVLDGACRWHVPDLPVGEYAVAAFQDQNGNGQLDTGLFGIPLEPYGFSNHAPERIRPPSYEQAKIDYQGVVTEVVVHLRES